MSERDPPTTGKPLNGKARRALRARAHALRPVVAVGAAGVTAPVVAETARALDTHELIKVKLPGADRADRRRLADGLCRDTGAELVQIIGRTAVLYREAPG